MVNASSTEVCDAWPVRCQTYGYLPKHLPSSRASVTALWPVPNYTAWWPRHMWENKLPKVVTWQWTSRDSNSWPDHESDVLATQPSSHTNLYTNKFKTVTTGNAWRHSVVSRTVCRLYSKYVSGVVSKKKLMGQKVAIFRQTVANFWAEIMGAQNFNFVPKLLPYPPWNS